MLTRDLTPSDAGAALLPPDATGGVYRRFSYERSPTIPPRNRNQPPCVAISLYQCHAPLPRLGVDRINWLRVLDGHPAMRKVLTAAQ